MKRVFCVAVAVLLVLCGCRTVQVSPTTEGILAPPDPSVTEQLLQTGKPTEQTVQETETTAWADTHPTEKTTHPTETEKQPTEAATRPVETTAAAENTEPESTRQTTAATETAATETTAAQTEATEAGPALPTAEFKRQVEYYAALYLNKYRAEAGVQTCQVLPGMSQVARMRASQLTYNFSHSTADKRAALAYYQYGRFIDATEFGGEPEESYYEADSAEAICAGFRGIEAEAMGKRIADMIRNSASHWRYIGSSEYSYIAVGVEYRGGTAYDWYGCVMVGKVNYG